MEMTSMRMRRTKLTPTQVAEIRRRWFSGNEPNITQVKLAREYGVHPSTISKIICGEIWKIQP